MVLGNLACTSHGATIVCPSEAFDAKLCIEAVEQEKCTSLYGVPTMFIAVLDHQDFRSENVKSLRTGIMAGALCPEELMKRVKSELHMNEISIGYGMTETSPLSTMTAKDDPFNKATQTVGRVMPHCEIKVIDPDTGDTCKIGEKGEFCSRGYIVMKGYWDNEQATRDSIDRDGWMHSGDLAVMDEEGYVAIVGRLKDMIIRGGENIYPKEVEEYLHSHPNVADVHVVGIPDDKYGEVVCAFVQPKSPDLKEADLVDFCQGQISTFKIPLHWIFTDDFPMTVTGKVQKFKLRYRAQVVLGIINQSQGHV